MYSPPRTTPLPVSLPSPAVPPADPPGERFELPSRPASVAAARELVRHRLTGWGVPRDLVDTARLIVSELVTNALLHTASDRIVCRVERRGRQLRIEVADQGPGLDPRVPAAGPSDPDAEGGRGLLLLDAMAARWGVISPHQGAGCTVWAEIAP
ncbi:ATP-binding protein [Streptomyces sp. NPDC059853]|uniref:ATP-binding protein n=1 Tax=Streptomyces sp. NPDC059853 TaxID=3346973 RepID=UPI00366581D6